MPVKKFEAKNIKEALALVKQEFGPDAVILAAKDMSKTHGLVGEKSVQVTAAISDAQYKKKILADQSLPNHMKKVFNSSSAQEQKLYINKVSQNTYEEKKRVESEPSKAQQKIKNLYSNKPKVRAKSVITPREITKTHYMDIKDDPIAAQPRRVNAIQKERQFEVDGRIQRRKEVNNQVIQSTNDKSEIESLKRQILQLQSQKEPVAKQVRSNYENNEVKLLKKQIQQLQLLVDKFQKVPQNFVSLHPGANEGLPFEVSDVYGKLLNSGFEEEHIISILKEACLKLSKQQLKNKSLIDAWTAQYLMSNIYLSENLIGKKYQVFIGGSGQGKTTTLLKMATLLSLNYKKKIAIVSLDNSRVGVVEQLKTYAQILNVPFVAINHASEWDSLYSELRNVDHVLVDTPSCNKHDYNSINDLKERLPKVRSNIDIHYVQSLLARRHDCFDQAQSYLSLGFSDVIFTHLDDSSQYGLIYNFQKRFDVPIHSFCLGPKVPEDYEPATREKFVDLIFNLSGWRKS